jgi:hypothetical protein
MFYSRPHLLSPNVLYLEDLVCKNTTDILNIPSATQEDVYDRTQSTSSCLEVLAELAARHFDNAFLSRATANAKEHYTIFRDIWKYFHSGAPLVGEDGKLEEEEEQINNEKEVCMTAEGRKKQRLSLGILSAKDLQELNSSESDSDNENLNPNNHQYTGVSGKVSLACSYILLF